MGGQSKGFPSRGRLSIRNFALCNFNFALKMFHVKQQEGQARKLVPPAGCGCERERYGKLGVVNFMQTISSF